MTTRPSLDALIRQTAQLPPGPEAWAPIFRLYPELSMEELAEKFREAGELALREADELEAYLRQRQRTTQ